MSVAARWHDGERESMERFGVVGSVLVCASAFGQVATFQILRNETFPFLGMDDPRALSADGKVVVGNYGTRWTAATGVVPTGFIPGTDKIKDAWAINSDGSIEVGVPYSGLGRYWSISGATTFTPGTPVVERPGLFGPCQMTDDGAWVIGYASGVARPARANRLGAWEHFATADFTNARAYSTSADGSIVVGGAFKSGVYYGIAWNVGAGPAGSASLIIVDDFSANAVSADGKVAAGQRGDRPAVWTIGGAVEVFNPPASFSNASAYSVSRDGRAVAGTAGGPLGSTVFVRRSGEQARDLRVVLERFGATGVEYFLLVGATAAMSRDGHVVCGRAYSPWYGGPWAFVASIPDWEPCPSDLNFDGFVDDDDFSIFAKAYDRLTTTDGDLNVDRLTDDSDFSIFAVAYDALLCP